MRELRAFHVQCSSLTPAGAALCANGRHPLLLWGLPATKALPGVTRKAPLCTFGTAIAKPCSRSLKDGDKKAEATTGSLHVTLSPVAHGLTCLILPIAQTLYWSTGHVAVYLTVAAHGSGLIPGQAVEPTPLDSQWPPTDRGCSRAPTSLEDAEQSALQ